MSAMSEKLIGGNGIEFAHFANRCIEGYMLVAPTTPTAQLTGTGNLTALVNISAGLIATDSIVSESLVQADVVLAAPADILNDGEALIFTVISFRSVGDGVVRQKVIQGAVALTAAAVPPTDADISATMAEGTVWHKIGNTKVARTGATSNTQTYDNTVRNTLVPTTIHHG